MDQKMLFIADWLRGSLSFTELCDLYGISPKTDYKWTEHYLAEGPPGLEDGSRRPANSPLRTPDEIIAALIRTRRRHPSWGARKILRLVQRAHPRWKLPHPSTVCDIFSRHGLAAQQHLFNVFRDEFNHVRAREALDQQPPASCYEPLLNFEWVSTRGR